uniref:ABC transmembrane type-1 domain-containing protein n=1 Tax=Sphenodon punctatus TaxID=8508 RepID=A0A8D0H785_SPHPU
DLFELNESDSPYAVCPSFGKQWRKEVLKSAKKVKVMLMCYMNKPCLLYPLWQTFKFLLIKVAFLKVVADVLAFVSPQIMKEMIIWCEHHSDSYWKGYGYAAALLLVVILQTLVHQLYQRLNMLTSVKMKTAVVGLIYEKTLTLANSSRRNYTTGEMVNLMSADTHTLSDPDDYRPSLARAGPIRASRGRCACFGYTYKCFCCRQSKTSEGKKTKFKVL